MAQTLDLGFLPWEAHELDRWLREGNPTLGWRGDNRLSLQIGVLKATKTGPDPKTGKVYRKGDTVAWRWEIWRHNEDGTDLRILQRKAEEIDQLIPALIAIDPRTPGHEPTMDRVEREDAIVQKEKAYAIQQAHGEHAEHLWKLVADRQNGKTTFRGMPGSNPDKQM